jgi:putative ATP-dependent endonuclease of the OLD family
MAEGVYLNKWISILSPELKEGLHYSIMFYGGRLLSNLAFDYDLFNEEIIPLLKINTNAFVLMDRDGNHNDAKINNTKKRVAAELGKDRIWITKGREIENYIALSILEKWLSEKKEAAEPLSDNTNEKLENILKKSGCKIQYSTNKKSYSLEISKYIETANMFTLDLKEKMEHLLSVIKTWN